MSLKAGRCFLTVFDELFDAVGDVKVALLVDLDNVAGLKPPILVKGVVLEVGSLPVALENVGPLDQELARLSDRTLVTWSLGV